MIHTPEDLAVKAAQIQALLAEAVAALTDPCVLESVARLALEHPELEWEPVALVAAALNARRSLTCSGAATAPPPLAAPITLPLPSSKGTPGGAAISLPQPPGFAF